MALRNAAWRFFLAMGLTLWSMGSVAEAVDQTASITVPGAVLLDSARVSSTDQLIPLGSIKEGRDGRAIPEHSERVSGDVYRAVYQLSSELGMAESKQLLDAAWKAANAGGTPLFRCEGRECGQSNLWANDVFSESLLFGSDRTQFAFVYASADLKTLTLLYGSERANRRSYYIMQTVTLTTPWKLAATAQPVIDTDRWQISVARTVKGAVDPKRLPLALNPVTSELGRHTTQHWSVIAHECSDAPAPDAFAMSQQLLDAVLPPLQKIAGKVFHPINAGNTYALPCSKGKNLEIIELRP